MSGIDQILLKIVRTGGDEISLPEIRARLLDDGVRAGVVQVVFSLFRLERNGMIRCRMVAGRPGLECLVYSVRTGRRITDGRAMAPVRLAFA